MMILKRQLYFLQILRTLFLSGGHGEVREYRACEAALGERDDGPGPQAADLCYSTTGLRSLRKILRMIEMPHFTLLWLNVFTLHQGKSGIRKNNLLQF